MELLRKVSGKTVMELSIQWRLCVKRNWL